MTDSASGIPRFSSGTTVSTVPRPVGGARQLRRSLNAHHSIHNRLHSIAHDAKFVAEVAALIPLPLVGNKRCGSWYAPKFAAECYFKSSDGHCDKWRLSLRRLNLHLIPLVEKHSGLLIVDATRRGRSLPDSFSKTVPIWAACINRAINATLTGAGARVPSGWCTKLHTAPKVVSSSEKSQIEARLDEMVEDIMASGVNLDLIATALKKPLRCLWITTKTRFWTNMMPDYSLLPFHPIVLLSASEPVETLAHGNAEYEYLQGAADDEESWARGLSPTVFWNNVDELLAAPPGLACEAAIQEVVIRTAASSVVELRSELSIINTTIIDGGQKKGGFSWIGGSRVAVGGRRAGRPPACWENFDSVINVTPEEYTGMVDAPPGKRYLCMPVLEGKKDRRELEARLPQALVFSSFVLFDGAGIDNSLTSLTWHQRFAYSQLRDGKTVLVHCAKGQDRSVGVVVAVFASFFTTPNLFGRLDDSRLSNCIDNDANFRKEISVDKHIVARALQWVQQYHPEANPSRHTLKKVHRFFMSDK